MKFCRRGDWKHRSSDGPALLDDLGHDVVRLSRALGTDLTTGAGLGDALRGVSAVIDVSNIAAASADESTECFGRATRNLLDAGVRAGVGHHVLLSILGVDRVSGNAHYAGKREQERLVTSGPVAWTIVRASQFHDFAEMVAGWSERDGAATIPPLLVQPIAPRDVAQILVEVALAEPERCCIEIAGPDPQDLVDMARRTFMARGRSVKLMPSWSSTLGERAPEDSRGENHAHHAVDRRRASRPRRPRRRRQ